MFSTNKNFLKPSYLGQSIYDILYSHTYHSSILLGLSCAMLSPVILAQELEIAGAQAQQINVALEKQEQQELDQVDKRIEKNIEADRLQMQEALAAIEKDLNDQVKEVDGTLNDPNLIAQIQQAAEDAKQQAQNAETQQEGSNGLATSPITEDHAAANPENRDADLDGQAARVDRVIEYMEKNQITLPQIQTEIANPNTQDRLPTLLQNKSIFSKIFGRKKSLESQQVTVLPKINVKVESLAGGDLAEEYKPLADNIKAKLSGFTQEAFSNFSAASPQLKQMTTQAAQAIGYYEPELKFVAQDTENLIVRIKPNQQVKVATQNIDITGPGAKRARFQVIQQVPDLNEGDSLNHALYNMTKNRIQSAAADFGFFDAYWKMHDVKVTLPENTADIDLRYETGERYTLENVIFRMSNGQEFPLKSSVLEKLVPFEDGDDYANWRINSLTNNLSNSRYFDYVLVNVYKPDAKVEPLEVPEDIKALQEQQAKIQIDSDPNQNAKMQQDSIVDQTPTAAPIHQHDANFAGVGNEDGENEVFTQTDADIEKTEAEAQESDQLKEKARENKKVPVIVYLNADNPNNLETGIGYGTDTGVRLRTQYRRSIVNKSGHSFDANLELSQVRQSIDGRYMVPYKHPLNDYFSFVGGYEREIRDQIGQGIELEIESAVIGAERVIKRPMGNWQHNLSVRYRLDQIGGTGTVSVDDVPDAFKVLGSSFDQSSLLFGYEISRLDQNNALSPTQGFRQFYRAQIGSESLLTETDLAILNAGWRFLYSLGQGANHQFVGRADLGYIVTDDFDKVPYNSRYFAGGDQSIRGFDYKSLSPKQNDLLLGGQTLAVGSLEYNYQFKEGWRAAIFADVGNAYDEKFNNETKYGAGLGIRWASPIGPIRLDVAAGVSEESVPIRLHFFIGPSL